jgi:hypothetical protein
MDVKAGMAGQPVPDFRGLVRAVVVADQVDVQAARDVLVDPLEEFRNSWCRWRRCSSLITVPSAMLKAANRLVMPCLA